MQAEQLLKEAGLAETFWGQRIILSEKAGGFINADVLLLESWHTCACGKQDERIPRGKLGEPIDKELYWLGCCFNSYIYQNMFCKSAECLIRIEKVSAIILAELDSKSCGA